MNCVKPDTRNELINYVKPCSLVTRHLSLVTNIKTKSLKVIENTKFIFIFV
jgi:hypothetical protein